MQNRTAPFDDGKAISHDRCNRRRLNFAAVIESKAEPYPVYAVRSDGEGYGHSGVNTVGQHRIHEVIRTVFQIIRPVLDEVGRFLLIKAVSRQNAAEGFIAFVCRNKETFFGLERLLFHRGFIEQIACSLRSHFPGIEIYCQPQRLWHAVCQKRIALHTDAPS